MRYYLYLRESGDPVPKQDCEIEVLAEFGDGFLFRAEEWISSAMGKIYNAMRRLPPDSPVSVIALMTKR